MARSRERKPGQGADAEREDSAPKPEGPAGDSPHRAATRPHAAAWRRGSAST